MRTDFQSGSVLLNNGVNIITISSMLQSLIKLSMDAVTLSKTQLLRDRGGRVLYVSETTGPWSSTTELEALVRRQTKKSPI